MSMDRQLNKLRGIGSGVRGTQVNSNANEGARFPSSNDAESPAFKKAFPSWKQNLEQPVVNEIDSQSEEDENNNQANSSSSPASGHDSNQSANYGHYRGQVAQDQNANAYAAGMNQPDEEEEDDAGSLDAEDGGYNSQEEDDLLPDDQF